MSDRPWVVPTTLEGREELLRRIAEWRKSGDRVSLGYGLLALSHLVKWVGPENDQDPFQRSANLAAEALEIFRETDDKFGLLRALLASSRMRDRKTTLAMLDEADRVAAEFGTEVWEAMALSSRASYLGMSSSKDSLILTRRALEIFRRHNDKSGMASSLFSLSIGAETDVERRDSALEAASIYRELGAFKDVSRCMSLAVMAAERFTPLAKLEPMLRQTLADAQASAHGAVEARMYGKLAELFALRGDPVEAEKYWRWQRDIDTSDMRTPLERWEEDVAMTELLIASLEGAGNSEGAKEFRWQLSKLMERRPDANSSAD